MPKVSVIVPNYNHAKYLNQRIDSILNQTYTDFELILLDDCSTDDSREVLLSYKEHPKVTHVVFNDKNSNCTFKQWEKGIKLAKGKYIKFLDSDDFLYPDQIEKQLQDLKDELRKVSWTSQEELRFSTKMVVLATLLFGLSIYLVDFVIKSCLEFIKIVVHFIFG